MNASATQARSGAGKFKRRQHFIKKSFQTNFILKVIAIILAGSLISSLLLYFLVNQELQAQYYSAHFKIRQTGQILLPSLLGTNFIVILVTSAITVSVVLYISHKIAGPLYRFEMVAREISKGNLNVSARLRQLDQLKDFSTALDEMIQSLRGSIGEISGQVEKLEVELASLRERLGEDDENVRALAQRLEEIKTSVHRFSV